MRTGSLALAHAIAAVLILGGCTSNENSANKATPPPAAASQPAAPNPTPQETPGATLAQWAQSAQLLPDLGNYQRKVSTTSAAAQTYFIQGLRLIYAFNHDEATRAFAKAIELDPHCAMCYWGAGEALGPNYNMPAMPDRWRALWDAVQLAQQNAANATPVERALIAALAKRYKGAQPLDPAAMQPFNVAYADAMRDVAQQFPDDDDVQVFFAEALMTSNAWKLWSVDGIAASGTDEIVATLEKVLARNPDHPGANHYYIHAVEASPHPEKALAAAERLPRLIPAGGHIVHMPAHILQRVGRYADASEANRKAIVADRAYIATAKPPAYAYYSGMYLAHNYQFLAFAASMQGRAQEALASVRTMLTLVPAEMLSMGLGLDWYAGELYFVQVRFGRWDEVLAEPAPSPELKGMAAAHLFARSVALAAQGKVDAAKSERARLDQIGANIAADAPAGLNMVKDVIAVASLVAQARIDAAQGKSVDAIAPLTAAIALEDKLAYDEPADWFFPVRHMLGATLLKAGKSAEAEAVYREDLRRNPANGWSLFGLAQALRAQGKNDEASSVEQEFKTAWKDADIVLTASAF